MTMVSTWHHPILTGTRRTALLLAGRSVKPLPFSKSALAGISLNSIPGQHTLSSFGIPSRHWHSTRGSSSSCSSSSSSSSHNDDGNPPPMAELEGYPLNHPYCNVTSNIASRINKKLHLQPQHPLQILHGRIQNYFLQRNDVKDTPFVIYDNISPIVSTRNNFDLLRIPPDHISRSKSDTYYLNQETVLRTHTSAHQVDLLASGVNRFLVTGDVYRRDEIDQSHYPVFHQTEGVKIVTPMELQQQGITQNSDGSSVEEQTRAYIEANLKTELEGLAAHLFGSDTEMRWVDAYFPFTTPSFELEIFFREEWLEVLGCGVIHPEILSNAGRPIDHQGWAFGLGLERLAMVLFEIPDIRLFWTDDERFHKQFRATDAADNDSMVRFQPYSKFPSCCKDMSFWIDRPEEFHVNDLNELVREVAGDLVEQVTLVDTFSHPKTNRVSHCYRISYRSMDRSLTNEEIDRLQEIVRKQTEDQLGVKLR